MTKTNFKALWRISIRSIRSKLIYDKQESSVGDRKSLKDSERGAVWNKINFEFHLTLRIQVNPTWKRLHNPDKNECLEHAGEKD